MERKAIWIITLSPEGLVALKKNGNGKYTLPMVGTENGEDVLNVIKRETRQLGLMTNGFLCRVTGESSLWECGLVDEDNVNSRQITWAQMPYLKQYINSKQWKGLPREIRKYLKGKAS